MNVRTELINLLPARKLTLTYMVTIKKNNRMANGDLQYSFFAWYRVTRVSMQSQHDPFWSWVIIMYWIIYKISLNEIIFVVNLISK